MNVPASTTIRLSGGKPADVRSGWRCPGCGVNWSPEVYSCPCSLSTQPLLPSPPRPPVFRDLTCTCPPVWGAIVPPPACPAHGQTQMIKVTC